MPGSEFKIVVDGGDWGSPMTNEATFDSLEEAQAEARSYLERQRAAGASLNVAIEEKAPDGTVVKHGVD
jgi:hypothetical protein